MYVQSRHRGSGHIYLYSSSSCGRADAAITKLTVLNFRHFDDVRVELRPTNIVVGSNMSSKTYRRTEKILNP